MLTQESLNSFSWGKIQKNLIITLHKQRDLYYKFTVDFCQGDEVLLSVVVGYFESTPQ